MLIAFQSLLESLGISYKFRDFPKDNGQTLLILAPSPLVDGEGFIEIDFDLYGNFLGIVLKG